MSAPRVVGGPLTRGFTLSSLVVVVLSCCATGPDRPGHSERPPDIVLVIADDMTYRDCGCYGNPDVRTPNIDRLAAEGMRFERMFTATAMCSPTRQQLFTGIFPVRNGAYPNHSKVKPGTRSIVHHLRALGYRVGLVGKRHIGPNESFPFEYLGRIRPNAKPLGLPVEKMEAFIGRDAEQPYCLVVASSEPHMPWNRGDASQYPPGELRVPPYLVDTPATRDALAKYYAEISYLDRQLGQCLELVDRAGVPANTMTVFTSEQGFSLPFGKWTCYELGLQTAFVVMWPGRVAPGATTDAMTQYVDVLPTLLEAAAGKVPAGLDGRSFLGVLEGRARKHRDFVFGVHTTRGISNGSKCYPIRSVRSERYKYIANLNAANEPFANNLAHGDYWNPVLASWRALGGRAAARAQLYTHRPTEELYDLRTDPYEQHNLADRPEYEARITTLKDKLDRWMRQQGDAGIETEMQVRPHRRQR